VRPEGLGQFKKDVPHKTSQNEICDIIYSGGLSMNKEVCKMEILILFVTWHHTLF
jgi:hypothetical protein